jgi:hypothetical protein
MPHHAELPPEESIAEHPGPANDPNVINLPQQSALDFDEDEPGPRRTPLRFGRLALWMASASALGIGVLGTVAYSMWFNHDQRVYAEAMASARQTLGVDQPAIAAQTQSAGAVETPATAPPVNAANTGTYGSSDVTTTPIDNTALADNAPTSDASDEATVADTSDGADAAGAAGAAALATTAAAQSTQPGQAAAPRRANPTASRQASADRANQAAQARRHAAAHAKPEGGGLFARMGAFFHRVSYRHNVPNRQREEYSRP